MRTQVDRRRVRTRLILASASPRRHEILTALGVPFEVVAPEVEETREGDPEAVVLENARRKAAAGLRAAREEAPPPGADAGAEVVLGTDTEVVLDGRTLGKPSGPAGARQRLEALSGRTHEVLSGVVVLGGLSSGREPAERSGVAVSEVTFRELDERTLDLYLSSGEWRDRAGAYAIQGLGAMLIDRVAGDFSNVVGLPIRLLLVLAPELLDAAGDPAPEPRPDSDS